MFFPVNGPEDPLVHLSVCQLDERPGGMDDPLNITVRIAEKGSNEPVVDSPFRNNSSVDGNQNEPPAGIAVVGIFNRCVERPEDEVFPVFVLETAAAVERPYPEALNTVTLCPGPDRPIPAAKSRRKTSWSP